MTDAEGLDQLYRRMVDRSGAQGRVLRRDGGPGPGLCPRPRQRLRRRGQGRVDPVPERGLPEAQLHPGLHRADGLAEATASRRIIPRNLERALRRRRGHRPQIAAAIRRSWPTGTTARFGTNSGSCAAGREPAMPRTGPGRGTFPAGEGVLPPAAPARPGVTLERHPRCRGSGEITAANGRLEIRLPVDFTTLDRRRLGGGAADAGGNKDIKH